MILIILLLNILGFTSAIRVPTSWDGHDNNFRIIYKTQNTKVSPSNYREVYIPRQENGAHWIHVKKKVSQFNPDFASATAAKSSYFKSPHLGIIYVPNARKVAMEKNKVIYRMPQKYNRYYIKNATFSQPIYVPEKFDNGWVPILNDRYLKPNTLNHQGFQAQIAPAYNTNSPNQIRAARKNDEIEDIEVNEEPSEAPIAKFEVASDVPTRVMYPGEGVWAIPGIKHEPYVRNKEPEEETAESDEKVTEKPEGYETFEALVPQFEQQREKFNENVQSLYENNENEDEAEEINDEEVEDDESSDEDFVPIKMLAQVRKTENTEHLPPSVEDPRLREVVKDSKIHTYYTEEGYEDIEYDHAGEEKNAEDSEGHVEPSQKNIKVRFKYPKPSKHIIEDIDILKEFEKYSDPTVDELKDDSESSESAYNNANINETKRLIMLEINNMGNGDKKMAIKILTKPYNKNITQEFVKIIPNAQRQKRSTDTVKYPYYNEDPKILNKNSPLRYAENMQNAPEKIEGEMSFYEHSGAADCPEIPRDIDPIPKKIKQLEQKATENGIGNERSSYMEPQTTRRLEDLGDKIDCLKVKYFGENPLDSPFFKEDSIEAPESIFEDVKAMSPIQNESEKVRIAKSISTNENNAISPEPSEESLEELPETAALTIIKRRRKRPQRPSLPPFEVNQFLPTPLRPVINVYPTTTAIPKHKILSEVYYKDEIKPNEQLNVFADIINNIKSSPHEALDTKMSENYSNVEKRKVSLGSKRNKARNATQNNHKPHYEIHEDYLATLKASQTSQIPIISPPFSNPIVKSYIYKGILPNKEPLPTETTIINVVGMSPPFTINSPARYNPLGIMEPTTLNTFSVPGMKPPANLKPMIYSDFKNLLNNRIRRRNNYHKIYKRSPHKPTYSEIKRNKSAPPEDEEEQEGGEEYIPRRNRNFHYDVENDRVVYSNSQAQEEAEELIDPEEEEEEEEPTTRKPRVSVVTEINGPSFLDYIQNLRSNSDYRLILEPKPIEKPKATQPPATQPTGPTEKPEFLLFLQKVKSNEDYKVIKETKPKPSTPKQIEEDVSSEETEDFSPTRNFNSYKSEQIFDITEYLPQPRIEIDYSKYKTIERAPVSRPPQEAEDKVSQISERRNADVSEEANEEVVILASTAAPAKTIPRRVRKRPTTTTTERETPTTPATLTTKRTRRRFRSTTTESALEVHDSQTQRVVRRKLTPKEGQEVPYNHKAFYSPIAVEDGGQKRNEASNQDVQPKQPVQVFKKYDTNKRHGGNYRRKLDRSEDVSTTTEIGRLADVVHKPFSYYSDPSLPASVNRLKETKSNAQIENNPGDTEFPPDIETKRENDDHLHFKDTTESATKNPVRIIKDPSKRLYFYAPVK